MALPDKSKQNGRGDSAPIKGINTGHHKKVKAGFFSADVLEIIGGLIFLVFGSAFHIAGGWFHIIGFTLDFLVVCCGLTIITHHVEIFRIFGMSYWMLLAFSFIIFTSLAFCVVRKEIANPLPAIVAEPKAVDIGTNEMIKFEARLVSFDGYPPGTSIGGMPFEKGFAYLKLDVKSQNKTIKNLDVKVALEKYLSQETIFDVAQISTFTGVTCFPAIDPGPLAIQGITQNGSNYTLPLEGGLQSPLVSQAKPFGPLWRIHCEEIFHNSTMSFAIKTKNMKNPMEPWQPVEIDVLGSYDIDGSGGIHNYPVKFSFEFPKNQNRGVSN